ncbi:MAG TPA: ubiquitin-like protein UBact [Verrucomicrobiae bacterium]|nr:ubiquitin-like protein UBact [Verrucomicrobiae bacterium]
MADSPVEFPERIHRPTSPAPWERKEGDPGDGPGGSGPRRPDVDAPDTRELLKKMRRVDPNQARRYRQRTGQ